MEYHFPEGFKVGGIHCGIKSDSSKKDLAIFVADDAAMAAAVYTQNLVQATSIDWNRAITPSDRIRAVLLNSGNANACTGDQGKIDNLRMAELAAEQIGAQAEQVLVLSTGIIGEHMPMQCIELEMETLVQQLANDQGAIENAADAMMTTDSIRKVVSRAFSIGGESFSVIGFAKGAGMIGPNMATMLAVILTDVPLPKTESQTLLHAVCNETFNCISVEGHTSTNDAVILLSCRPTPQMQLSAHEQTQFRQALGDVCTELARKIPSDGEGATHLIEINVSGTTSRQEADQIARTIANSALVKTAITGADPNWGRIVSAAGFAGVNFCPEDVTLSLNNVLLFKTGNPVDFDARSLSGSMQNSKSIEIDLCVGSGAGSATHWTSNLTHDYVRINADYHT